MTKQRNAASVWLPPGGRLHTRGRETSSGHTGRRTNARPGFSSKQPAVNRRDNVSISAIPIYFDNQMSTVKILVK